MSEAAIDVGDFPHLISRNWRAVFSRQFPNGGQVVQNISWLIKEARDKAAHPDTVDLDIEFTRSRLYDITDVLSRINAPAQRQEVEEIRSRLLSDTPPEPSHRCRRSPGSTERIIPSNANRFQSRAVARRDTPQFGCRSRHIPTG